MTENILLAHTAKTLEEQAQIQLGLSGQEVREAARRLYALGLITYPDTDCGYIPKPMYMEARKLVKKMNKVARLRNNAGQNLIVNPDHQSEVWHVGPLGGPSCGIVPLKQIAVCTIALTPTDFLVYQLICQRFLLLFVPGATPESRQ